MTETSRIPSPPFLKRLRPRPRKNGYLLVRPAGGWTDQLVQIAKGFQYCRTTERALIVDTHYPKRLGAGFDYFFDFKNAPIPVIYKKKELEELLEKLSRLSHLYPPALKGQLNTYQAFFNHGQKNYSCGETPLQVDFKKTDYPEPLLVHHGCGGGDAAGLFQYLKLSRGLQKEFKRRLAKIPKPYTGIHVRNTDRKTKDLESFYKSIRARCRGRNIFLATDDSTARNTFLSDKTHYASVSFFSRLPEDGLPLHMRRPEHERLSNSIDALCDLLLLISSSELHVSERQSGFSQLALSLHAKGASHFDPFKASPRFLFELPFGGLLESLHKSMDKPDSKLAFSSF